MAYLYILYSKSINRFYTGSCLDFDKRFIEHQKIKDPTGFTAKASDWEEYLVIDNLFYEQARKIEKHIKRMKSAKYIVNLNKHPEIIEKLKLMYNQ
ncbi:MAG: GIY-YIG nuclease family protein [Bacteroidia bacterium]|nr:GIY-YIG nuclease family protein [Bacteroidia bacterium]